MGISIKNPFDSDCEKAKKLLSQALIRFTINEG